MKGCMHPSVHGSTVYNRQDMGAEQPKCPSADKWIKKMWYIYTIQRNITLSLKENEIMLFVAPCMDLEIIISEVSQTKIDII